MGAENPIPKDCAAMSVRVEGVVQGVGFRPFTARLARHLGLCGEVLNDGRGVLIRLEGPEGSLAAFLRDLVRLAPALSRITYLSHAPADFTGLAGFSIAASDTSGPASALTPPDASTCPACLAEVTDEKNRRFRYPFTNCTDCGPRFSIIRAMPYDRPNTAMADFIMCPACKVEYENPLDRRYHAQPNACPECGPRAALCDAKGRQMDAQDPVRQAARLIASGHIVAVKGLGGFHLAVDAMSDRAVGEIRKRKGRFEKPFAIMCATLETVKSFARVNRGEAALLTSVERPIVLLQKTGNRRISPLVAPGLSRLGVMLAYTPLHHLLLLEGADVLVMTSANRSGEPLCAENVEAFSRLGGIADYFLVHDRPIANPCDDSVARVAAGRPALFRRSRGYAPAPVFLRSKVPPILAVGAQQKNAFCLANGDRAFLSQHVGELENEETLGFFSRSVKRLESLLAISPEIIACDMHPDYLSTKYAQSVAGKAVFGIWHHHAHIASAMAENRVEGKVIGIAADGAGLGPDGRIWGCEVLIADFAGFRRAAHLAYTPMPGSEAAVRQPWRMALAYLKEAFGDEAESLPLPLWSKVPREKISAVKTMLEKSVNCPATSSLGRLFDGIAAMAGVRTEVTYEGQAAMELEAAADLAERGFYEAPFEWGAESAAVPVSPLVTAAALDMAGGVETGVVSARFHNGLVRLFTLLCEKIRQDTGINQVALSGGVFQNRLLLSRLSRSLKKSGLKVLVHGLVPANDGGIALGQAVVAATLFERGLSHALVE